MGSRPTHDVIVLGASMGGVQALSELLARMPGDLPACVLVVQHLAADGPRLLADLLDRAGPLPVRWAKEGDPLAHGRVYVAPPDHHLRVGEGALRLGRGPRENYARPAIDVLFRSAAVACGSRVVGVVLTGLLFDGAAGLAAVALCGGTTVVQDPASAPYPEMPQSALARVRPTHQLPLEAIPGVLVRLASTEAGPPVRASAELVAEARVQEERMDRDGSGEIGRQTAFTCPECGGTLWERADGSVRRYRCRVGHVYVAEALLAGKGEAVEDALWAAVRTLEERVELLGRMAADEARRDRAGRLRDQAEEARDHAETLRAYVRGLRGDEAA